MKTHTYKQKYQNICHSMLSSYKKIISNSSQRKDQDIHIQTVAQQKNWQQISHDTLQHKNGVKLRIQPHETLRQVVQNLIIAELHTTPSNPIPIASCETLIDIFKTLETELPLFE